MPLRERLRRRPSSGEAPFFAERSSPFWTGAVSAISRAADAVRERTPGPVRDALALPTGLGWTVAALGVVALPAGWALGWRELQIGGAAFLLVVLLALYYTVGRTELAIDIDMVPPR